mgnify:CR=1 FL=1
MVLWQAGSTGKDQDVRVALQNNMRSAQHRAWRPYMLYAQNMQQQGNTREAKRVLDEGFAHFERAPVAWHEYIGMQMQFKDTDKAQKLAAECQKRFPAYGPGCRRAQHHASTGGVLEHCFSSIQLTKLQNSHRLQVRDAKQEPPRGGGA